MNIQIKKYEASRDYKKLQAVIHSEGAEWQDYLKPKYQSALAKSITYVAYKGEQLCGYSRSINDNGIFIWVLDLLVAQPHRGHAIGKQLMECLLKEFPNLDVFVLSDVDEYYDKLGYDKEGTVYKVG
jgi:GNAT superfamily N-acetyltransferase